VKSISEMASDEAGAFMAGLGERVKALLPPGSRFVLLVFDAGREVNYVTGNEVDRSPAGCREMARHLLSAADSLESAHGAGEEQR
jgi:hypothetical protein